MPIRRANEARPPGEARRPPRRVHPCSERSTQRVPRTPHPEAPQAGEARRPPRRVHPRSERSTQRVPRTPRRPSGRSPRPPRRAHPFPANLSERGTRESLSPGRVAIGGTRCVERSEHGCTRLGGRRASPGFGASCGPANRHGLHPLPSDGRGSAPAAWRCAPSEGAPPAGQARFAHVLRAAGARLDAAPPCGLRLWSMLASLALHRPQAPDSRVRRCAPHCGTGSLRSRPARRVPQPAHPSPLNAAAARPSPGSSSTSRRCSRRRNAPGAVASSG